MDESQLSKREKKQRKELLKAKAKLRQKAPRYVLLMGLPASGKSTFSNRLQHEWQRQIDELSLGSHHQKSSRTNTTGSFLIANQDRLGRKACIDLVSKYSRTHRIIVDRCNPLESDRNEWVQILNNPPKTHIALIHFVTNVEDCVERAKNRVDHETIKEGRGERIIRDIAQRLEVPTLYERKYVFDSVFEIETFEQCENILRMWGC